MYKFIISCLIIICLYAYFIKYVYNKKKSDKIPSYKIPSDKNNYSENMFKKILDDRLNLLKNMSYDEWIAYNKKHKIINQENTENIFIYEKNIEQESSRYLTFVNRVFYDDFFENLSFDNISTIINGKLTMTQYRVDASLIKNMFYSKNKYDINSYFWITKTNNTVKNKAISVKFKKDNIEGVIGISFPEKDMNDIIDFKYYSIIDKFSILYLIIFIFLTSYIISYLNENISIVIMFIINLYIIFYLNTVSETTNYDVMISRLTEINNSTFSIVFLLSLNIFIINYTSKNKITHIYYTNILIFYIIVILLLWYLMKRTNFIVNDDVSSYFLFKILLYNLVIAYNIFIFTNYLFHITPLDN